MTTHTRPVLECLLEIVQFCGSSHTVVLPLPHHYDNGGFVIVGFRRIVRVFCRSSSATEGAFVVGEFMVDPPPHTCVKTDCVTCYKLVIDTSPAALVVISARSKHSSAQTFLRVKNYTSTQKETRWYSQMTDGITISVNVRVRNRNRISILLRLSDYSGSHRVDIRGDVLYLYHSVSVSLPPGEAEVRSRDTHLWPAGAI